MRCTLALLTWLAVAACAVTETGGPVLPGRIDAPPPPLAAMADPSLVGTLWTWQGTLMSDDRRIVPDAPERYTLEFQADGKAAIRADCNRGATSFTLSGNALTFGPIATTRAMCPPGSRDADFLKGLQEVSRHLFRGDDLVLTLKFDSGSMRFTPAPR